MPQHRQIIHTHLSATSPDGTSLAVVTYADGRCGVARDNQPLDGHDWPQEQMAECTQTFLRLAGLKHD